MYSKFIENGYLSFKKRPYLPVLLSILQGIIAIILFNLNIPDRNSGENIVDFLLFLFLYGSINFYVYRTFLFYLAKEKDIILGFFPATIQGVYEKTLLLIGVIPVFGLPIVLINSIRFFGLFKNQDNSLL